MANGIFSKLNPADPHYAIDVVDSLIPLALARGASDVHLHPRGEGWEVLVRIDGVLSVTDWIKGGGQSDPVSRLMVLAGLPTYRSSQPMEGRMKWKTPITSDDDASLRLGIFPTVHGPRAVLRLLRKDDRYDTLESLGLSSIVTATLRDLANQTDGAILLSGPAGSGKTTTLYAMLRCIAAAEPRRSVLTIEDPVESVIDSISQSELDVSGGMTLASALRSAVRQDSEVLLVSEIRDPETAEAAMQASLTGHLVFSSLHATDVAASLRRLVQFGVPPHVVRSGVRAILAQRLLRRICSTCQAGSSKPNDCDACSGTGYRGRVAIAQCVMFDGTDPVGESLSATLESAQTLSQMRCDAAAAAKSDLRSEALRCVEAGWTDEAEVYRVLGSAPLRS
ncbi:GspE/PulE family protein [Novipirellula artificiosorum]|nr:ATPase, T2SS/T4P/T4SS family [Novipirellula artificiosorum]